MVSVLTNQSKSLKLGYPTMLLGGRATKLALQVSTVLAPEHCTSLQSRFKYLGYRFSGPSFGQPHSLSSYFSNSISSHAIGLERNYSCLLMICYSYLNFHFRLVSVCTFLSLSLGTPYCPLSCREACILHSVPKRGDSNGICCRCLLGAARGGEGGEVNATQCLGAIWLYALGAAITSARC